MWRSTLFWHQKLIRGFIERHKPRNPTATQDPSRVAGAATRAKAVARESDLRIPIACSLF
jgi:hypothetical protein